MSNRAARFGVALYCVVLFLGLDWAYSNFLHPAETLFRSANETYHHGLRPNVTGVARWGRAAYPIHTNSLGFRDAAVREVSLTPERRRIVLIGNSFTEGIGVAFEESFAGLLAQAGERQRERIEVLNAGVATYSPVIYFKKIKALLDNGFVFHELMVLSDISDVQDEATDYFCIDDDPRYRKFCKTTRIGAKPAAVRAGAVPAGGDLRSTLKTNFVITDFAIAWIRTSLRAWRGSARERMANENRTSGWTIPGFDVGASFDPLGIEGGIARSLRNMQALADLLRERGIALTVVVYPWPMQLEHNDRSSRQVTLWRDFCAGNCKAFIDLFPAFFAEKDADSGWYERLFIIGDVHFSVAGNRVMARELEKHLFAGARP